MPYSREHVAQTRARIIDAAMVHFKSKGFDAARVDDIMASAGLTRGGFYAHFESKEELFVTALAESFERMSEQFDARIGKRAEPDTFRRMIAFCFDSMQRDDRVDGCPPANLSTDAARGTARMRDGYTKSLRTFRDHLVEFTDPQLDQRTREVVAVGLLAEMIGTVMLARGVNDPELSDHFLELARKYAERVDKAVH